LARLGARGRDAAEHEGRTHKCLFSGGDDPTVRLSDDLERREVGGHANRARIDSLGVEHHVDVRPHGVTEEQDPGREARLGVNRG